jgi:hypothetical protein
MSRLEAHKKELYELRFSPMCKPAAEVANLTQLESHTTRARTMMLWRIVEGHLDWGSREVELLYESTLDSISEAFDVYHYPISRYMLDARADVWQAGLAPQAVKHAVEAIAGNQSTINNVPECTTLVLAGEIAQLEEQERYLNPLRAALNMANVDAAVWAVPTGATAYALGAWDVARSLGEVVIQGIQASGARTVIADGPETAWALTKIFPDLDLLLPENVRVELLSDTLSRTVEPDIQELGKVFFHDGRPAFHISESLPNHLVILPGYKGDEAAFGDGVVYKTPRNLLDKLGADLVSGTWSRALSKSCGADDGLWLTHPELAMGLAAQRLDYARQLGATMLVSDSPLCASYLARSETVQEENITVRWLPEIFFGEPVGA